MTDADAWAGSSLKSMAEILGVRAKACWKIQAGIVPGVPLDQYTRDFWYTSEHNEQDTKANPEGRNPAYHSILARMRAEALDYYLQVSMPQLNNWATIEFVWF